MTSMTLKYVYEDWVNLKFEMTKIETKRKLKYLWIDVGATHRGESMSTKYEITLGFVISWIGLVIINGTLLTLLIFPGQEEEIYFPIIDWIYEQYKWSMAGKLKSSKKQGRESHDVPLIKMSDGK